MGYISKRKAVEIALDSYCLAWQLNDVYDFYYELKESKTEMGDGRFNLDVTIQIGREGHRVTVYRFSSSHVPADKVDHFLYKYYDSLFMEFLSYGISTTWEATIKWIRARHIDGHEDIYKYPLSPEEYRSAFNG